MFVSWVSAAKVEGGISSIHDVTKKDYYHSDNMESFMFAETLKYVKFWPGYLRPRWTRVLC